MVSARRATRPIVAIYPQIANRWYKSLVHRWRSVTAQPRPVQSARASSRHMGGLRSLVRRGRQAQGGDRTRGSGRAQDGPPRAARRRDRSGKPGKPAQAREDRAQRKPKKDRRPGRQDPPGPLLPHAPGWSAALVGVGAFVFLYQHHRLPDANADFETQTSYVYYDDGKTELGAATPIQNRDAISYDEMPQDIKDAVVAAENRSFWTDNGIDVKGIVRAAFSNASGNATQGASTITQQYIKILYLTQERSYKRKLKEAILSLKLQRTMSKQEILEGYLNTIYFGRGAYGIQAAAQAYFDKPAAELDLKESRGAGQHHQQPEPLRPGQRQGLEAGAPGALRATCSRAWPRPTTSPRTRPTAGRRSGCRSSRSRRAPRAPTAARRATSLTMVKDELLALTNEQTGEPFTEDRDRRRRAAGHHDVHQEGDGRRRAGRRRGAARRAFSDKDLHVGVASVRGRHRRGPRHVRRPGLPAVADQLGGRRWPGRLVGQAVRAGGRAQGRLLAQGHLRRQLALRAATTAPRSATRATTSYGSAVNLIKATEDSINTAFTDLTVSIPDGPQTVMDMMNAMGIPPRRGPGQARLRLPARHARPRALPRASRSARATVSPINMASGLRHHRQRRPLRRSRSSSRRSVGDDGETLYDHSVERQAGHRRRSRAPTSPPTSATRCSRSCSPAPARRRWASSDRRRARPAPRPTTRTRSTRRGSPATRRSWRPR